MTGSLAMEGLFCDGKGDLIDGERRSTFTGDKGREVLAGERRRC